MVEGLGCYRTSPTQPINQSCTSNLNSRAYSALPDFNGNYPVIGSWIVGDEAAGMGIRENTQRITTNTSRFVPHYFT